MDDTQKEEEEKQKIPFNSMNLTIPQHIESWKYEMYDELYRFACVNEMSHHSVF